MQDEIRLETPSEIYWGVHTPADVTISDDGKQIYVMGHPEYDRYTLDKEYRRDKDKGLPIEVPVNYYPQDDDSQKPLLQWRSHGNLMYYNYLNYYVYQTTPYEL